MTPARRGGACTTKGRTGAPLPEKGARPSTWWRRRPKKRLRRRQGPSPRWRGVPVRLAGPTARQAQGRAWPPSGTGSRLNRQAPRWRASPGHAPSGRTGGEGRRAAIRGPPTHQGTHGPGRLPTSSGGGAPCAWRVSALWPEPPSPGRLPHRARPSWLAVWRASPSPGAPPSLLVGVRRQPVARPCAPLPRGDAPHVEARAPLLRGPRGLCRQASAPGSPGGGAPLGGARVRYEPRVGVSLHKPIPTGARKAGHSVSKRVGVCPI